MLPLDDEGVAYALVALRNISRKFESTNFFQENPGYFLFFKKVALWILYHMCIFCICAQPLIMNLLQNGTCS